jgi:hypothetical protein
MTVTDTLRDLAAQAYSHAPDAPLPEQRRPPPEQHGPGPASPYPLYWLVRSWSGAETDELGRGILERAIYVSPHAAPSDHEAAVEIITDALCRWAHPDDIRWCHLPDGGTGGYTIVGRAIRSVSQGDGCDIDEDYVG